MLLILAGVSISLVVGDNGVMTRATDASSKTKYAQAKEAMGIAINELQTEYFNSYITNANDKLENHLKPGTLCSALEKQGYVLSTTSETETKATATAINVADKDQGNAGQGFTKGTSTFNTFYIRELGSTSKDYVACKVKVGTLNAAVTFANKLSSSDGLTDPAL